MGWLGRVEEASGEVSNPGKTLSPTRGGMERRPWVPALFRTLVIPE